ncbi:MAG: GNAT family N-acetyltransferase [Scrofimicrobium sp.]
MDIDVVAIPRAKSVDEPLNPLYQAFCDVDRACEIGLVGNGDLVSDPMSMQIASVEQKYANNKFWVAFPEGERDPSSALGTAFVSYSTSGNTHLAEVSINVHPEARSRGVAKALLVPVTESIQDAGRTSIATWTEMRPYEGEDGLAPKTGVGQLDPNAPSVKWVTALGFALEQCGRRNLLEIASDGDEWWSELDTRLSADLERAGNEYELLQWSGGVPEDLRADMANLHTRMSTDEPNAGMDYEEVLWDEERIAHADTRLEQQGWDHATTAVRHAATGELVAYSEVMWQKKNPAAVIQEDTFVLAGHRGHRLGAITKAVNLKYLREVNPAALHIYTWNAGENEYMLAINDELGFKVASVEGAWQKRLEK